MSQSTWKDTLLDKMSGTLAEEIDIFEAQMELRRLDKVPEAVFAEARLRRGVYGQRYDNGQRHDGQETRQLNFPCGDLTKGHETVWDAPGMVRIKIPFGGMTTEQMDVLADLADEYSDTILHVTTRQDIQLHFVHIEDTPDLMRRLAAVGITTREACGNSVRNVTACPIAGVCQDEAFDVTPYASALTYYLLGHPDVQDFGRKFKIAFSGCSSNACGLVNMHDMGFVAQEREIDGKTVRGFAVYVGGGLGAVPQNAKLLSEFTSEEEILPLSQAVCRVFARLGERKNRNKARIKFLVKQLGIEEFTRLVEEERKGLPVDERWTAYLEELPHYSEKALKEAVPLTIDAADKPEGFDAWVETNVYKQRQAGYAAAMITLPLGDLTSDQFRKLTDIARKYVGDNVRCTVEQNILLRWVSEADLPAVYQELKAIGLAQPGAGTIVDITACPGTDTCKLGIAASRGLAGELRERLIHKSMQLDEAVRGLRIKVSGCFNSCGQHHIADMGFYGNSRKVGGHAVPHFQVVLGGQWTENAAAYGLAMGAVPSKAIPDVIDAITDAYVAQREKGQTFQSWIASLGKKAVRELIAPFMQTPDYAVDKSYYTDWGDPREFTIGDMGVGECAGEIVSLFAMEITVAESKAFDAQVELEEGHPKVADELAYEAMVTAARALVLNENIDVGTNPDKIVKEFRERFYDTKIFYDKYAKGKFGQYLFNRHEEPNANPDTESARQLIEEAQLFIEAVYACDQRISAAPTA